MLGFEGREERGSNCLSRLVGHGHWSFWSHARQGKVNGWCRLGLSFGVSPH